MSEMMLFTGNANPELAQKIASNLNIPLGKAIISRFSDGEIRVEILENVRGKHAFIIQPTCAPTNDNLMELIITADALYRSSANLITAVVPYFGYGRQDKRVRSARVPITAKVIADMMSAVHINRVITVDLHADQIQGFFDIPVDNVYGSPLLVQDIKTKNFKNLMIVSPDVGGVMRARAVAKRLDIDLAIIDKRRLQPNESEVMNVIGDIIGRDCILIDDIVDTAGTLCNAAGALLERGANSVTAYCIHPVFSGNALENITRSCLKEIVVTDTVPLSSSALACKKIRQISLGSMLGETIKRVNHEESISSMFFESS
ncbi:MAG: Ribose-phosphate pyrophosphokinase [Legionellaceae bacterium]